MELPVRVIYKALYQIRESAQTKANINQISVANLGYLIGQMFGQKVSFVDFLPFPEKIKVDRVDKETAIIFMRLFKAKKIPPRIVCAIGVDLIQEIKKIAGVLN